MVESQQQETLDSTPTQPVLFQRIASLAEQTISTYKQPAGTLPPPPPPPSFDRQPVFSTRLVPEAGKQHPFNPELNTISRFPLSFRGGYACGQEDHFCRKIAL